MNTIGAPLAMLLNRPALAVISDDVEFAEISDGTAIAPSMNIFGWISMPELLEIAFSRATKEAASGDERPFADANRHRQRGHHRRGAKAALAPAKASSDFASVVMFLLLVAVQSIVPCVTQGATLRSIRCCNLMITAPNHRKHHQGGENLLCLHHLSRMDEQIAHAALARAADHFRRDDQDDGHAHAELQAGQDARQGGGDHDLDLNLPGVGAQILVQP